VGGDVAQLYGTDGRPISLIRIVDSAGVAQATGVQYVEDSALAANAAQGTLVVARRTDTLGTLTPAVDDAVGLRVSSRGALWVAGDSTFTIGGDVVHDAIDGGNPVKVGGKASSTPFANVASNDRANLWLGLPGQAMVGMIIDAASSGADGTTLGRYLLPDGNAATNPIPNGNYVHRGATDFWDRARGQSALNPLTTALMYGVQAVANADGDMGTWAGVTNNRELQAAGRITVLSDLLSDSVRADMWTTTNANGGTAAASSGETLVQTSANANGSSQIVSKQTVPILHGTTYRFSAWVRMNAAIANNTRRFGLFTVSGTTPQDGYAFELIGATPTVNVASYKAGAATATASGSWGRFASAPFTFDTNEHLFEIDVNGDVVTWLIDGIVRAAYPITNTSSSRTASLNLPAAFQNINATAAATNQILALRGFSVSKVGAPEAVGNLSSAPNYDAAVLAVGAGPGFDRKLDPAGVAANSTSSAVVVPTNGADMMAFHVTTIGTTPGSMIIETSGDDGTWATAGMVVKQATGPDTRVEGSFVPAVNDVYLVRTTGLRQVRYRVNAAYASGTATVKVTASLGTGMVKSIDMAPAPHNMGYATTGVTAQYTTTQTSTTLGPTVSSSQRMVVTSIQIDASGTTAGSLQVYFGTGAYSRGTNKAIFDGGVKPSSTLEPGIVMTPAIPWVGGADEELKVTDSAAINALTITVWYYLIAA